MSEQKSTTLLDLVYAACRIGKQVCIWSAHLLGQMIRLTWRKWYIAIPMICLGFGLSMWITRDCKRAYKAEGVLILNGPNDFEITRSIYNLQNAMPACMDEQKTIQSILGISDETAWGLDHFDCYPVIDFRNDSVADVIDYSRRHNRADTIDVVMTNRLAITFRTKNVKAMPEIQEALLRYLNEDPQHQAAYEAKKKDVEYASEFCRTQIAMLDSFSTTFYFQQGTGQQSQLNVWREGAILGRREIIPIHQSILQLMETQKKVDHELSLMTAPVVVDSSFAVSPRPVWRRLFVCPAVTLAAYILGLLLAWAIEDRKKLFSWLNKRD